jgi:hypothetical protein
MNIFGYKLSKERPEPIVEAIKMSQTVSDSIDTIKLSVLTDLPMIGYNRTEPWVNYGVDNLYPEFLKDLYNTSPTHNAIVKTKAQIVVGEGFKYNDTNYDEKDKINILKVLNQIDRDIYEYSLDFQIYGAMALELIWSLDFTKVVEINRIDPAKLRSGKYEEGEVTEWYYKRDWRDRREEAVCIYPLDKSDKQNHRQLLYIGSQMVSNEYYYEPSYIGAIDWITLESQCGVYYRGLIENGFSPTIVAKFYRKPATQEERDIVMGGLKKNYTGVKGNKILGIFSDGKELAPDINPIEVSNMDKQFTVISDQITQKIITGERATPELCGIAIPGQLGNGDFDTKVKVFSKFVIRPDQRIFEKTVNQILMLNGYDIKWELNAFTI